MLHRTLARIAALSVLIAAISGCQSSTPGRSAPVSTTPRPFHLQATVAGSPRDLPADFFGVNGANFIRGADPTDPRFLASLGALRPESLRLFGGTTANYWDWRTGSLQAGDLPRDLANLPPSEMTLDRWKELLDASGAAPIFDLNIVTSTLDEQLEMLRSAEGMGMQIERVELGNELYQNVPEVVDRFPSPQSYATVAKQWAKAIKDAFPGVQVALVGALAEQGRPTPRKQKWNAAVGARSDIGDAMTLHPYLGSGGGSAHTIDDKLAERVVENVAVQLKRFRAVDLAGLPAGEACWVSEFNIFDRSSLIPGSWLHGLLVAQISIALAAEPQVEMAVMHALVGNPAFAAMFGGGENANATTTENSGTGFRASKRTGDPYALTGAGEAMQLVYAASRDASEAQPLRFGSARDVVGIAFMVGSQRRLLIANLGPAPASLGLDGLVGADYRVRRLSAAPGVFVSGPGAVESNEQATRGALLVAPWSLNVVG